MFIIFLVMLLIIIFVSALCVFGEKEDQKLRDNATSICVASILAFAAVIIFI